MFILLQLNIIIHYYFKLLFVLERRSPNEVVCPSEIDGFEVFGHMENLEGIIENVVKLHKETAQSKWDLVLSSGKSKKIELCEFKDIYCKEYFQRYFEELLHIDPVILPQKIPSVNKKIVNTMDSWCKKSNKFSNLKGLIVHKFSVLKYLKLLFDMDTLNRYLDIKDFPRRPAIIVFNSKENVILLIRKANRGNIEKEINYCNADLKVFMVLFWDELKDSGMKIIPLVANTSEVNEKLDFDQWTDFVVSVAELETLKPFETLWDKLSSHCDIVNTNEIDERKVYVFLATLIGFVATDKIHNELPTFSKNPIQQMKGGLLMLTPEQMRVLDCQHKHVIITGPYGSGKTIIILQKLKLLAESLPESDKVYFICFDSKSELSNQINGSSKIKIYHNYEGYKLSEIMKQLLSEMNNAKNVNFIVDEYDGEDLDEIEAKTLHKVFKEEIPDAFVLLAVQPMEKERTVNDISHGRNRFDLLETMKTEELTLVMRNSVEISILVRVTHDFLQGEPTIYRYQREKKQTISQDKGRQSVLKKIMSRVKASVMPSNSNKAIIDKQAAASIDRQPAASVDKQPFLKVPTLDSSEKQENIFVGKLEVDEAFGFAGIPRGNDKDKNKIVNKFTYKPSKGTGHKIHGKLPELLEMTFDATEFQKALSLKVAFEKLNISSSNANNRHVVLHFSDTRTNEIPKLFEMAFRFLNKSDHVTSKYQEFKTHASGKSILVCNFRAFRGLENATVTIVVDHDIYSMQHYLVEAMARCTSNLAVVVLQKSPTISGIVQKWINGVNGKQLIDYWKIEMVTEGKKEWIYNNISLDQVSKVIFVNPFSKEHKQMEQQFNNEKEQEEHEKFRVKKEAEETIRER